MAIRISLEETASRLFCCSKWWGDPDMPEDMAYPMIKGEDGEEYPLTFVCQIDCADIAAVEPESGLPHEGMLYFFAAIDEYLGYEVPYHNGLGRWPKGTVKVKYAKIVNPETFESYIMVDDNDEPITMAPLKMEFSICGDDEEGLKILGTPYNGGKKEPKPAYANLLQIDSEDLEELQMPEGSLLNFLLTQEELDHGWFHSSVGHMTSF